MKKQKNQDKLDRLFSRSRKTRDGTGEVKSQEKEIKKEDHSIEGPVGPHSNKETVATKTKEDYSEKIEIKDSIGNMKSKSILEGIKRVYDDERKGASEEEEKVLELLTFYLSEELYAIETGYVESIIRVQKITEVPGIPDYILGVTNLKGNVISVVDIRKFLDLEKLPYDTEHSIIIINCSNITTGLFVDGVGDVVNVPANTIDPPLSTIGKIQAEYILGETKLNDNFLAILHLENLMNSDRMKV